MHYLFQYSFAGYPQFFMQAYTTAGIKPDSARVRKTENMEQ